MVAVTVTAPRTAGGPAGHATAVADDLSRLARCRLADMKRRRPLTPEELGEGDDGVHRLLIERVLGDGAKGSKPNECESPKHLDRFLSRWSSQALRVSGRSMW